MGDPIMVVTEQQVLQWMGRFIWPFMRVTGLVMSAPLLGSRYVPVHARVLMAAMLGLVLAAALPNLPPVPADPWSVMVMATMNIVYGATLGFIMWVAVSAITVSGEMMGLSMGLGFAKLSSPANGTEMPVVSAMMLWAGLMAYLAAGGPIWMVAALYHSFVTHPFAQMATGSGQAIARAGADMFLYGLWLALPVVIAGIAVNAVLGVVTAMAPSLNIFSVGFPLLYLVGLWLMLSTSGDIQTVFMHAYDHAAGLISSLVNRSG